MRRLLTVAYHFPPDNSSTGVMRTLKFVTYLKKHGWVSDVISVPDSLYPYRDEALAAQIPPHVAVHRVWAADASRLFSVAGRFPSALGVPDRYWTWIPPAIRKAAELHRDQPFDALYTTYPIGSAHLIGWRLKRALGLPWIADFRDPWVEDSLSPLRHRVESWMERRVVRNADRVILNTPAMLRHTLQRYPQEPADKFMVIPNGYDEADFANLVPRRVEGRFHIVYAGGLSAGSRNPSPLLAGVRHAIDQGWLSASATRITFLGGGPFAARPVFRAMVEGYGLQENVVTIAERIPHAEALAIMGGADALVVLAEPVGEDPAHKAERHWSLQQVPAKTYEYLRLGVPVLALVSEGALADLLWETGGGRAIAPQATEEIARTLRGLREAANDPRFAAGTSAAVARYAREHLTQTLARCLAELCEPAEGGEGEPAQAGS